MKNSKLSFLFSLSLCASVVGGFVSKNVAIAIFIFMVLEFFLVAVNEIVKAIKGEIESS